MTAAQELLSALEQSLTDDTFVRLSLSGYRGGEENLKSIHIRRITIKRAPKLSFTHRYKTRDIVKNHDMAEAISIIGTMAAHDFHNATLFTTAFNLAMDNGRIKKQPPTETQSPPADHDRAKNRALPAAGQSWLHELGVTDAHGTVNKTAQDKYRQINKYIEIIGTLIKDMPGDKISRVADMGSGKGYLTFALYDHLHNTLNMPAHVTGVEYRADMVALCNDIARKAAFNDLRFTQGSIADYDAAGTDMLIALHACDTATDDALAKGIAARAALIVVAPCCHKQVRRAMEQHKAADPRLAPLLRHGIFMERQAEMATDALRALILEQQGYRVKVFEFISDAHTPKNVMITAIRDRKAADPAVTDRIAALKQALGIDHHYLESALP